MAYDNVCSLLIKKITNIRYPSIFLKLIAAYSNQTATMGKETDNEDEIMKELHEDYYAGYYWGN